jgi:hypothetical protein
VHNQQVNTQVNQSRKKSLTTRKGLRTRNTLSLF